MFPAGTVSPSRSTVSQPQGHQGHTKSLYITYLPRLLRMDNVIFEDPSKPRVRPQRHVQAAPASSEASYEASSIRECPHEVQPQAVTPVSDIRPQEHSHTTSVGHSGKSERPRATLVIPAAPSLTAHSRAD